MSHDVTDNRPLLKLTGTEFPRLQDTEYGKRKVAEAKAGT